MLLYSLELENVRSYRKARIDFGKGRMLLSGDIGAGKSTILLAVEFALFGLIRGWNDGEKLMRHGSTHARVRLNLDLGGDLVIERSLKRTSSGIQQGEVRINDGVERLITPSEARSLIIARLGYPSEFVTKQPMLFRYTIFTPQESMKQIVEERPEARLSAIRTIFGIDRYEAISRNAHIVARSLKQTNATRSGRLERKVAVVDEISSLKQSLTQVNAQSESAEQKLAQLTKTLEEANASLEQARSALEAQRARIAQREQLLAERADLEKELESLVAQKASLAIEEVSELPDLKQLEERLLSCDDRIRALDERLESERERFTAFERSRAQFESEERTIIASLEDLDTYIRERSRALEVLGPRKERFSRFDSQAVERRLRELEASIVAARDEHARLDERIRSARERIDTMPTDTCPTCRQRVTAEHRDRAIASIEESIETSSSDRDRIAKRIETMTEESTELSSRLEEYTNVLEEEKRLPPDRSEERSTLAERLRSVRTMRSALGSAPDLEPLREERAGSVSERDAVRKKLARAQELHLRAERAVHARERRDSISARIEAIRERMAKIDGSLPVTDPKVEEFFTTARAAHAKVSSEHLEASKALDRLLERSSMLSSQRDRLLEELSSLRELERKREELDGVIRTLSDQVPDLASRVESAIMRRILIETNDHFSKWFSVLVEDLEGYLDESFTPRIVQSGYDVSFENLSGGERTSVALAFRLALHEAINHITGQSATGLLILDEPTEGFSSEQLDAVRSVLAQLRSEQVIIVSHEPLVESFVDSVIRIEKSGMESSIR